ncbi:amino acid ABC transporter ATP-binding protein [Helicobacter equorum]|uniref:Amino acid ABC transporter ATP-binding protein n=1 Tax=Helicobacter equorum TaxID=361872 RepID=A0A3D8IN07_9HELI|nr:amino acid ABC transporter ATP-binding protein [Helicobacter equorum]MDD7346317.1 amino acid ABC transporter ATP-binding protein [Helicobacter sp.]MDY2822993.1 amino acid ABC transporter ATP-binding protein [Helicobacter sp.]RDU66286.1 amino acid ABC transporter ATP-binding protein [Helicobacter equorum]
MITIQHLSKSFHNHMVLKDIALHIQKNKTYVILGPSGSGKSTLLRCMNLLEYADSGTMNVDGVEIDFSSKPKRRELMQIRKSTGMVFQNYNLFANKTALQNITQSLITVYKYNKKEAQDIAYTYLEMVGLKDKANHYPSMLSGGQQQRIGIARALAFNPKIMLFDEPTSALDPELVNEVLHVIKMIKDKTMILVTHELNFARKIADRILFMADGEILENTTPQEFFTKPQTQRAKQFLDKFTKMDCEYVI